MSEWKKIDSRIRVRDQLPHDKPFIALWKGNICFVAWDEDDGVFYMALDPTISPMIGSIAREREEKITHWMEINIPPDY